ncbi:MULTISPECIES: hypothetical protein [unclassified Aureispira]|uniref:hypothetical protein n=1 Tax=unclassified Aureispira TaxID=2649989 RepID=UPI000698AFA1|nr:MULTISPECIES: hypothetical protein [unclassified Aureispira]WMX15718.1 hypothetical protein QP953_04895 [Aureispira sp. CCB-E]
MEILVPIIAIIMIFSIPLVALSNAHKLKLEKLKATQNGGNEAVSDLRKQVGHLMAENDEIKERLKNLEYLLTNDSKRIDLDYEKEQIRIDQQNKFNS